MFGYIDIFGYLIFLLFTSLFKLLVIIPQEEQYCKWMAACKLASKGKTMADSSFDTEVHALQKFLAMQKTTPSPEKVASTPNQLDIQPEDFVSPKYIKKIKSKTVGHR